MEFRNNIEGQEYSVDIILDKEYPTFNGKVWMLVAKEVGYTILHIDLEGITASNFTSLEAVAEELFEYGDYYNLEQLGMVKVNG